MTFEFIIFFRERKFTIQPSLSFVSTLGMYTAFQYPALPTLDGHFISQIKALCRENMIVSLVKTASDLEMYAREAEISCGNVDQLLRPTFNMYRMTPPKLPAPVPLTAYPLDFRAPEGNLVFTVRLPSLHFTFSSQHRFLPSHIHVNQTQK